MANFDFVQASFTRGELTPRLEGRIDFERLYEGVETLQNFIVLPTGGVQKRPGTRFVSEAFSDVTTRLLPFEFNDEQTYVLEFSGDQKMRFFADEGLLVANDVSATITNPTFDDDISGWTDNSAGSASIAHDPDGGDGNGALELSGGSDAAKAEQAISITETDTIHSLTFEVYRRTAARTDGVRVKVGSSSDGNDLLDSTFAPGFHLIDVDPNGNSTIYLTFENSQSPRAQNIDNVEILSNEALRLTHPYAQGDLFNIKWVQSADVLWLAAGDYEPMQLKRFGAAEFSLVPFPFKDGPYLEVNDTDTTFGTDNAIGYTKLTASSTTGVNDGQGFLDSDVGRLIRLKSAAKPSVTIAGDGSNKTFAFSFPVDKESNVSVKFHNTSNGVVQNVGANDTVELIEGVDYQVDVSDNNVGGTVDFSISQAPSSDLEVVIGRRQPFWGWCEIVERISSTEVRVHSEFVMPTKNVATKEWRLGAWSGTTGWPEVATFHDQRLVFGSTDSQPQNVWTSETGSFDTYAPTDVDGTVVDTNGINVSLNTSQVNAIRWMESMNAGLAIGTSTAEFLMRPATTTDPLSPTSVEIERQTNRGSTATVLPAKIGHSVLFVQRGGRTMREIVFDFNADGLVSQDFSLLSEHLLRDTVVRVGYQQNNDSILWALRNDARLIGLTLERDQNVSAWHQHVVGGQFGGQDAFIESMAVISEGDIDQIWMVVRRDIDNGTKRHIEFMEEPWLSDQKPVEDAFFVDSGLTYDGSATDTISGLDHLEGETVSVLADGATHPNVTVESGTVTLDREVEKAQIGLPYTAKVRSFPFNTGVEGAVSSGKFKRAHRAHLLFLDTVGGKIGYKDGELDRIYFRKTDDTMDDPVPVFSGVKHISFPMGADNDAHYIFEHDEPLPATLLNVAMDVEVYEARGNN